MSKSYLQILTVASVVSCIGSASFAQSHQAEACKSLCSRFQKELDAIKPETLAPHQLQAWQAFETTCIDACGGPFATGPAAGAPPAGGLPPAGG